MLPYRFGDAIAKSATGSCEIQLNLASGNLNKCGLPSLLRKSDFFQ